MKLFRCFIHRTGPPTAFTGPQLDDGQRMDTQRLGTVKYSCDSWETAIPIVCPAGQNSSYKRCTGDATLTPGESPAERSVITCPSFADVLSATLRT